MSASDERWIAVHTQPGAEFKAELHLRRQGYSVYLPRYLKLVRHARRRDHVARPLFPRYLFVNLAEADMWRPVRSTIGVSGLICSGEFPAIVPSAVIGEIRAREDQSGLVRLNDPRAYKVGEPICVDFGSCSELEGIFESVDDQERVTVLLKLLGRHVKVRLSAEAIRARA
jgi:transcriptional antiterminator RfaH